MKRKDARGRASLLKSILVLVVAGCGGSPDSSGAPRDTVKTVKTAVNRTEDRMSMPQAGANHLIGEKSPYLLQHAYNPVEWYPWSDAAFARARREDKPIFLSIGYSTCHWCHVMEKESFENPEIAELMNRTFINIKVDREEHPDIDGVYMSFVTAMTGQGGWPMTIIMTPEGEPFYGGTYFPPVRRWNTPGMTELVPSIAKAWAEERDRIVDSARRITESLREQPEGGASGEAPAWDALLERGFRQAKAGFDPINGGFGAAPKFPRSHELSFLLCYWKRSGEREALDMVTRTLDAMGRGGMRDVLGGGFHRYSTDGRWLVPHFEKMLYDQALLARTYTEAYQVTRDPDFGRIARETLDYALRDLRGSEGAFYSAEDADSEGEEGKFYVWGWDEWRSVLGEDADIMADFFGVTEEGNFESHRSILHLSQKAEAFARSRGLDFDAFRERLTRAKALLLERRNTRVRPHRDDKILTSWNGLMIAALAYASVALEEPRYLEAAERAAAFINRQLMHEGRLLRRYRDGDARYPGTLEDYAFYAYGMLELYQASYDPEYLRLSKHLAERMIEEFWDPQGFGFHMRSNSEEPLVLRSKGFYDGAVPSGNSMAAGVLLRLSRLIGDTSMEDFGRRTLKAAAPAVQAAPFGFTQLLMAADDALGPSREVVIAGLPDASDTRELFAKLNSRFLPRTVRAFHPEEGPGKAEIEALIPYVVPQIALDGRATAYVCERQICRLPTSDPAELERLLEP